MKIRFFLALLSLVFLLTLPVKSFANIENAVQCYDDQKYSCAFDNFKKEFDQGNYYVVLFLMLGELYYNGNGVDKDINIITYLLMIILQWGH